MSKRAEEMALIAHPDKVFRYKKIGDTDGVMTGESVNSQQYIRDYFIEGYEQAEKDLALTWEDVAYIVDTFYIVEGSVKEKCEEVLRRFNEYKKLV